MMEQHRQILFPYVLLSIIKNNQILLFKRSTIGQLSLTPFYSLPGGKVEAGETMRQTAVREALEELDIVIEQDDLQFFHVVQEFLPNNYRISKHIELSAFCFIVKNWHGTIRNKEPEIHESLEWFDLDALPHNLVPVQRHVLEMMHKKIPYSEFFMPESFFTR